MNEPHDATESDRETWPRIFAELGACQDFRTLRRICRTAARVEAESGGPEDAVPLRVALIGGATLDLLAEPLRVALLARGFLPELFVGGYGQYVHEMLDAGGPLDAFEPQVVVVMNTPFNIGRWPELGAAQEEASALAEDACKELLEPCRVLHERLGCEIVVNTVHALADRGVGNLGARLPGDPLNFVRRVNLLLGDTAPSFVHLNDVAALAERHGTARWIDLRYWYQAKQPLAFDVVAEYARNTAAIVGAIFGRRRKVAILDLDNTLWGGVIGDDGLEGIQLGEGSPAGEAFKAFQVYLRSLKDIGILLAVCSKNETHIAEEAFEHHPEMVLRREDFVAFKANWDPKSDNIRAISNELDLGLDSFVFIDDNPAEREQVRQVLPHVAVPDIGEEPADFAQIIAARRYFEPASVTAEDRHRTSQYQARRSAAASLEGASDLSTYLRSLDMKAVIRPFEPVSMERITQLTNKTNQFNLTTHRVTRPEMERVAGDAACVTRTLRLRDKFGDHGLVSVFWARVDGDRLLVENWLMSCRVLKRGAEHALFNEVLREARKRGLKTIVGEYRPTDRNALVEQLYPELGFSDPSREEDGSVRWTLDIGSAKPLEIHIEVESRSATS